MSDQLCSFYESRKKYRDLYDLHLSTGDLCAALNIAISKLDDANIDDVENIFNYVVAEECFARKGFCPLRSERDDAMKKGFRSFLMDRVSHWRPTFSLLSFFEDESRPANFSRSEEGLAKDFMSLFVSVFLLMDCLTGVGDCV